MRSTRNNLQQRPGRHAGRAVWLTGLLLLLTTVLAGGAYADEAPPGPAAAPADAPGDAEAALESARPRQSVDAGRIPTPLIDIHGLWVPNGPRPIMNGQTEGLPGPNLVDGAVHDVAPHPTNANILYIGTVNGGVWKTTNATAPGGPSWTPLTDTQASPSIGALEFDPVDPTGNHLVAGIGRFSAIARLGGPLTGLLRTTDGGSSWTPITHPLIVGESVSGLAPRGVTLVMTANSLGGRYGNGGVFRSIDGGTTWSALSGDGSSGLPPGDAYDLVSDPNNASRLYASVYVQGIYRSDDVGATWTNISSGDVGAGSLTAALNLPSAGSSPFGNNNTELAVASDGRVYVAVLTDGQASYIGFTTTPVAGTAWTAMDLPRTPELAGPPQGLNPKVKPGGQGAIHFSIVADPGNPAIVYVGGDRQPSNGTAARWPNFVGASDYSGRLFRGDTTVAPTGGVPSPQWAHLTHSNAVAATPTGGTASGSSPHADSRDMEFDANGNLIQGDDGGIYIRTLPGSNAGDWLPLVGDLQITEIHDIAYDAISQVLQCGNQDTGSAVQVAPGAPLWNSLPSIVFGPTWFYTGDGGDVEIGPSAFLAGTSDRFSSYYSLGTARLQTWAPGNLLVAEFLPTFTQAAGAPFGFTPQFYTPVAFNPLSPGWVVFGAVGGVWESTDSGNNITFVPHAGTAADDANSFLYINDGSAGDALVYGGNGPAPVGANPSVIYAGGRAINPTTNTLLGDYLLVRTAAGGNLTAAPAWPGGRVVDIALDPADWRRAYAIDAGRVFETIDAGVTFTDVTGDLFTANGTGTLQSIAFVPDAVADGVVVGSDAGVYVSRRDLAGTFGTWVPMGAGLPNVPVYDLLYAPPPDDIIVAGTLGRGAWVLPNATAAVDNVPPTVSVFARRSMLWPPRLGMLDVALTWSVSDNFDPPNAVVKTIAVTSDEQEGTPPFAPDGTLTVGPPDTLRLRAQRAWPGNGRIYLIHVQATDVSGNIGNDCSSVLVPAIPTVTSLTALKLDAANAEATCIATGAPPATHAWPIVTITPLP